VIKDFAENQNSWKRGLTKVPNVMTAVEQP
jgi:hypothetical protein